MFEWPADKLRRTKIRANLFLLTRWYSYRREFFWSLRILVALSVAALIVGYWRRLDSYLLSLSDAVIPELAIGVGAAITGIIAIAFSLSLFAIQQVADRGTPATLQAYARDLVLKLIYWVLAIFATICFAIALLKPDKDFRMAMATTGLLLLFASFVLLNLHFTRVVKFADPRYTVLRIFKQGQKQLRTLQAIRDRIDAEYQTREGKSERKS